jgi:hypothetical protein
MGSGRHYGERRCRSCGNTVTSRTFEAAGHPCDPALESNRESTVRRHAVVETFEVALERAEVFARPSRAVGGDRLVGSFGHLGQEHADLAKSLD